MAIARPLHEQRILDLLRRYPVVAILGARQAGKTTLARQIAAARPSTFFDLEDRQQAATLDEPTLTLDRLRGLVVLDEIQRRPELFPTLRVLADRPRTPARFLVLGSASVDLLRQSSESLAGRIAFHELPGLSLEEVGLRNVERLWLRGGFPRSYTARSDATAAEWRQQFIRTFLERDLPQLGIALPAGLLERFWTMLAHYHGQVWNASELARSFGVAHTTVARWLEALTGTFVVELLRPWAENVGKRVVKSPKVYVADSGLVHSLLGLRSRDDVERHPKLGASWEGFVLGELRKHLRADRRECYFWATHAGAELDFLVVRGNLRRGFEIKRTDAPRLTPSMQSAITTLGLQSLDVIHAGSSTFALAPHVRAVAVRRMLEDIEPLGW
ncbi:MAG: hypothetical protein A2138_12830 [Deltaproteobacteria bacterium RBG_16_71_12]|nr:MAG: hypothetical protein A2138_12830 [Deltaproteobacteria bacterium RBG_16_71_12]